MSEKQDLIKKRKIWKNRRLSEKYVYKKTTQLHFRCTKNEAAYIQYLLKTKYTSYSLTDFILESVLYNYLVVMDLNELDKLSRAINHLGNNINQIARTLNTAKKDGDLNEELLNNIHIELNGYKELVSQLLETNKEVLFSIKNMGGQIDVNEYDSKIDYSELLKKLDVDSCPCMEKDEKEDVPKS